MKRVSSAHHCMQSTEDIGQHGHLVFESVTVECDQVVHWRAHEVKSRPKCSIKPAFHHRLEVAGERRG